MQSLSTIPFTIERSKKRRKSIAIVLKRSRGVIIQAPHRTPDAYIQEIIAKRESWIQKKWTALQAQLHEQGADHFENGRVLPLLDRRYILEIWPLPAQKNQCECINNILLVRLKKQDKLPQQEQVKKLLEHWYRQQANEVLVERTRYFAEQMNVQPQGIIIKTQKNRWGSCDRHNVIRYNWKVMMAPSALLDYLVVHELAHIREKNHSPAFWAVVAAVLPNYMQLRKALREFHACW